MAVLTSSTFEQRSSLYEDVRSLISPGFLAHQVEVNEVPISLRSLGVGDFFMLKHRIGRTFNEKRWQVWLVVTSVWMVDGQVVVGDQKAAKCLQGLFMSLPSSMLETLSSIVLSLVKRMDVALDRAESYMYEHESRYTWKSEGRGLASNLTLGSAGILATNPVQRLWCYYNTLEDEREAYDKSWSLAKFTMGPHAPKSIDKLNTKDREAEEGLRKRRQAIQDRMYYSSLGVLPKEGEDKKEGPAQEFHVAYSVEELEEQMRAWVAGDKDDHDQVVDAIKAKIRYEKEEQEKEQIRRQEELARYMEEEGLSGDSLQLVTGERAQEMFDLIKNRQKNPGARRIYSDNKHNSAYDKYIRHNPEIGSLHLDENGRLAPEALDIDMKEALLGAMKSEEKRDLGKDLEGRKTFIEE